MRTLHDKDGIRMSQTDGPGWLLEMDTSHAKGVILITPEQHGFRISVPELDAEPIALIDCFYGRHPTPRGLRMAVILRAGEENAVLSIYQNERKLQITEAQK